MSSSYSSGPCGGRHGVGVLTCEKELIAGGNNSGDKMSWEEVSDLYIPVMHLSRMKYTHLVLIGIRPKAWGDAWVSGVCILLGDKTCVLLNAIQG